MKTSDSSKKKKARGQIPQSVRFNVFRRDGFKCRYCGKSSPEVVLHCDHAVSVRDGGGDGEDNLVTACIDCNLGKSSKSVQRPAPSKNDDPEPSGLIGFWGHTFDNGEINWQFKIIRRLSDDTHMCQLFSWMSGDPTECKPIPTKKLLEECNLYTSQELMSEAYSRDCDRRRYERERARSRA